MDKETIIFALTSSNELAGKIADSLRLPLGQIQVDHFADGEILVTPKETVRGRSVFVIQSPCPPVTERLMEVLVCIDALRRASAREINVIMPYYGYARQDRKASPRQPITAKLVADLIQTAGADRVVTVDLHAAQIQGFFNIPTDDLTAVPLLSYYFTGDEFKNQNLVVVSPDHGGVVRARRMAEILNAPIAIVDKRRPRANEVEAQSVIGDIEGKTCIVVDDICDTAGSLVAACKILKEHGAGDIYTAITHGVFSRDALEKIENSVIKQMVITDTIPLPENFLERTHKIQQVSIADMISDTIDAISNHKSVAKVYQRYDKKK